MPIDYYIVLGVSRGANLNKIKKAYRNVVKKYHPDVGSPDPSSEKFRAVTEAYETLSDSEKRRAYDTALKNRESTRKQVVPAPEPLIPQNSGNIIDSLFSRTDDFFDGFVPGIIDRRRFRSPVKDLFLEAVLSPSEARNGGLLPLTVPVVETCPHCQHADIRGQFFCPVCGGSGRVQGQRSFSLSFPPHTRHGTRVSISLEDIGLKGVNLNVVVRVDPDFIDDLW